MAMMADESNNRMLVAIRQVDLVNMVCTGWSNMSGSIPIYLKISPGGVYQIPTVGDQWIIQKLGNSWYLDDRTDWQDEKHALPPAEGLTAVGGSGPTYILGDRVDVPSEFYIGGTKYSAGGPAPTAQVILWDAEMVLNAGALASGYNDLAGGILVNNPNGVMIDSIVFRLGGDPGATIGGSGGITVRFYRGTTTSPEVTQIGAISGMTAHDSVLTLTTPYLAAHDSVLRAKVTLGSATVAVSCHVQFRGRRL